MCLCLSCFLLKTFLTPHPPWEDYFGRAVEKIFSVGGKIILAGEKIVLSGEKIILAGKVEKLF